ncbi:protein 5NUC-like [Scaptodrosophila lebanonensis]|uniref:5'-nucleotidase n=1 Tax=Drosophila lebanonensis TaxID=7225 RepID=A0A6J2U3Y9_DROLE|nr:protein 5NUC-like [Scaptodrosophila lebanonensis]
MIFLWSVLTGLLLCGHRSNANPIEKRSGGNTEFIILHNNDMHARFEQTNVKSGKCSPKEVNTNKCYGGFARVAYEVRKYRAEAQNGGTPVLYLNAGDTYTGTPWFTIFKDNITAAFLNKLQPDAISLGNHEFDEKVEGLIPFLNNVDFPVLACNLDLSKVPELAAANNLANSTILEVNGLKVGIIGYVTPDTKKLTVRNDVEFLDEIVSINAESAKLTAQGIQIIIALGHSGYIKDQEIAKNCPDVDIVIGGHTNTFLYNGKKPDAEAIEGPYPTQVKRKDGKVVPVVQAYAYTKYLGKLHVKFDSDGNLVEFDGAPILLNASVEQEKELLDLLDLYRPNITALDSQVVGHTKVDLEGSSSVCRARECNLGNLVADSMVFARVMELNASKYWTDAPIAFIQGGGIRNSIMKAANGSITASDVLSVLPFQNGLYITRITGKALRNSLEHSASVVGTDSNGGFLQLSGARVQYDYGKPKGQRVVALEVRCAKCDIPSYEALNETAFYNVIVDEFLLLNGDGYELIDKTNPYSVRLQNIDADALIHYLQMHKFVYPGLEGRILSRSSATNIFISLALMLFSFILTQLCN